MQAFVLGEEANQDPGRGRGLTAATDGPGAPMCSGPVRVSIRARDQPPRLAAAEAIAEAK